MYFLRYGKGVGVSENEINRLIEESRKELITAGKNPDDYFKTVQTTKFMM